MKLKLRIRARHKPTGIEGRVVGMWEGLESTFGQLEYVDKSGSLNNDWFLAAELEAIDTEFVQP